jgi:hypothetical protein
MLFCAGIVDTDHLLIAFFVVRSEIDLTLMGARLVAMVAAKENGNTFDSKQVQCNQ